MGKRMGKSRFVKEVKAECQRIRGAFAGGGAQPPLVGVGKPQPSLREQIVAQKAVQLLTRMAKRKEKHGKPLHPSEELLYRLTTGAEEEGGSLTQKGIGRMLEERKYPGYINVSYLLSLGVLARIPPKKGEVNPRYVVGILPEIEREFTNAKKFRKSERITIVKTLRRLVENKEPLYYINIGETLVAVNKREFFRITGPTKIRANNYDKGAPPHALLDRLVEKGLVSMRVKIEKPLEPITVAGKYTTRGEIYSATGLGKLFYGMVERGELPALHELLEGDGG
jgi:hypothetical protein